MAQQTNLAEIILEKSSELFREQGYVATTIKQIARAAGCTTAALYYYYEGGKSEILSEVVRSFQKVDPSLISSKECSSLSEFIVHLTTTLAPALPLIGEQMGWLMLQFSNLPDEIQQTVQSHILDRHAMLKNQIICFTDDETEADRLAWVIFNAFIGYQQVFFKTEIGQQINFNTEAYGQFIAQIIKNSRA
jgi:AcrR family transcriptional regulator